MRDVCLWIEAGVNQRLGALDVEALALAAVPVVQKRAIDVADVAADEAAGCPARRPQEGRGGKTGA